MGAEGKGFDRSRRLLKPTQYGRVFEDAGRSSDDCFTILYRHSGEAHARLGLAISKKALKRAVDRNRVKRVVREGFRHNQQQLAGLDLVVMVKRGLIVDRSERLARSLERHWRRIADRAGKPVPGK